MDKKTDVLITKIVVFILKYGLKYIATIFLFWSVLSILFYVGFVHISVWGTIKIPHFISNFFVSIFPSIIKGKTSLKYDELLLIFMQIVLAFEIINELIKFVFRKYWKPVKKARKKTGVGFLNTIRTETKIITLIFLIYSVPFFIDNKLDESLFSKFLITLILYASSWIFLKIYIVLDYAAENLAASKIS